MKRSLLPVVIAVGLSISVPLYADTVSGTVRYENKTYTGAGFTGTTEFLPVRFADVEIVNNSDNSVLGSGETTASGTYSITVPNGGSQTIFLRVYARQDNASFNIVVRNNQSSNQIYTAKTTAAAADTNSPVTINLDVTISGGAAGVFNIFDVAVHSWQFQATVDTLPATLPQLLIYWESGSTNGTYYNATQNVIFLLGRTSDPDEFDDDIILHEIGHFVAKNFSKDDSPGGAHAITSKLDVRLAWSEGWAHYWSSAVRRFAGSTLYPLPETHVDNFGSGNSVFDIETPSMASQTVTAENEVAVAAVLWDISDANNEAAFDTLSLGDGGIWTVVNDDIPSRSQITLEDFFNSWIARFPAYTISTTDIFSDRSIKYFRDARDPSGGENNTAAAASPLSGTAATNTFFPAGDEDWFSFAASAGDRLRIETSNLGDGCDTVLTLFDGAGATQLATNDDRVAGDFTSLIQFDVTATGSYRVRVTAFTGSGAITEHGYYDVTVTIVANSPPTILTVTATQTTGEAPLLIGLSGTATDTDGQIALYQWDFTGDGNVDYTSSSSASVSFTYSQAGTFNATLIVTDDRGSSASSSLTIVVTIPGTPPTIDTSVTLTGSTAPVSATYVMNVTGITAVAYEWDFESDGVIDAASIVTGTATFTYRAAGSFLARGYVVDREGRRYETTFQQVIVNAGTAPPAISDFTLSASSGNVPLTVSLTVLASDPGGGLSKIEWDFEGDGRYDRETAGTVNIVSTTYTVPGTFTPKVRVTDTSGLQATRTASLLTLTRLGTAGWIREPQINDSIAGDFLTITAEVVPSGVAKSVQFQYRTDSPAGSWTDIGSPIQSTETLFSVRWDIRSLPQFSVFDLRALIDGTTSTGDDSNTITILSTSPRIREYIDSDNIYIKEKVMDVTRTSELFLSSGAGMILPLGASDATSEITVRFRGVVADRHAANGSAAGMVSAGASHEVSVISGTPTFRNYFTLKVPYTDSDDNGYIDGTNGAIATLNIHWYSPADSEWKRDGLSTVDRLAKRVEVQSSHMTEFGAFASLSLGSAGSGGGGGGGCGSVGLDLLLPAGLIWLLRRGRRK